MPNCIIESTGIAIKIKSSRIYDSVVLFILLLEQICDRIAKKKLKNIIFFSFL